MFSKIASLRSIVLFTCISVQLLATILQIVSLVECKQCLLFARIFEIDRVLKGGFFGFCYILILHGLLSILMCSSLLSRRPILGILLKSSRSEKHWTLMCCLLTIIATILVVLGWKHFCDSFQVVRCYHTPSRLIDWKAYTPKYSNCYNTYYYYTITEICFVWSSLSTIYVFLNAIKNDRTS